MSRSHVADHGDDIRKWFLGVNLMPWIQSGQRFQFLTKHEHRSGETHDNQVHAQNNSRPQMYLEIEAAQPHPLRPVHELAKKLHGADDQPDGYCLAKTCRV
jgi:hypothetical protein